MKELETKLLSLFSDQEIIMTGTDDASEIEPFKAAEEAFEKLVDAEVAFEMARAGMITGNGRRLSEAQTSKEFYEFRRNAFNESSTTSRRDGKSTHSTSRDGRLGFEEFRVLRSRARLTLLLDICFPKAEPVFSR